VFKQQNQGATMKVIPNDNYRHANFPIETELDTTQEYEAVPARNQPDHKKYGLVFVQPPNGAPELLLNSKEYTVVQDHLDLPDVPKLTVMSFDIPDRGTLRFVTTKPYPEVVKQVLRVVTEVSLGTFPMDEGVQLLVGDMQHFPVLGDAASINEYVDERMGYHVHVNCEQERVYVGRNTLKETWGFVDFGKEADCLRPDPFANIADAQHGRNRS
jgi:hypothetical protein